MSREWRDLSRLNLLCACPLPICVQRGGRQSALSLDPFVRCIDQVELSASSLNSGDAFILDTFGVVYVWYGAQSNRWERVRALQFAHEIKVLSVSRVSAAGLQLWATI